MHRPKDKGRDRSPVSPAEDGGKPKRPKKRGLGRRDSRRQSKIAQKKLPSRSGAERIGPYLVMKRIGKGAMGTVYMATNKDDGSTRAIKRISMKKIPETEREGIETEVRMLKYLSHPNIVKFYDVIREDKYMNIILEYVPNGALSSMLSKFGMFTETLTCHYISQVLDALSYLHQQGIIHRDIKGANILADADGIVKLADFGVAMNFKQDDSADDRLPAGTMNFMAPEVVKMVSAPTYACDIWSVGATVIELLTGHPPYSNEEGMAICYRIVNDDHPPLPANVSPPCTNFLLECFQKDPALRISANELSKHHWLEAHRSSAARKESKSGKKVPSITLEEQLGELKDGGSGGLLTSPKPTKLINASQSITFDTKMDLKKYADDVNDETGFEELEICDDVLDRDDPNEEPEEQILELEISWNEDTKDFSMDNIGLDQLRFNFETTFEVLGQTSDKEVVLTSVQKLHEMTIENPGRMAKLLLNTVLPNGTGMMVLMDQLGGRIVNVDVACCVIKWVNTLMSDEVKHPHPRKDRSGATKFQERLCILGMTSVILKFCQKGYDLPLRVEAAEFALHMCRSNLYTRKMFCACGGLRVLVTLFGDRRKGKDQHNRTLSHPIISNEHLPILSGAHQRNERKNSKELKESDFDLNNKLLTTAIDCLVEIFEIKDNPKDDFCRLLCEYGLLPIFTRSFKRLRNAKLNDHLSRVVKLFAVFSGANTIVRKSIAKRLVVEPILHELNALPEEQVESLIRSLKMICGLKDPNALDQLAEAGAVEVFVKLLDHPRRGIYNQLILCLDMLMIVNPVRRRLAVEAGLIPRVIKIMKKDPVMDQVLRKILCSLPIKSAIVRSELHKHGVLSMYIEWMSETSWRTQSMLAICLWLKLDTKYVTTALESEKGLNAVLAVCEVTEINRRQFLTTLPLVLSMLVSSRSLRIALSHWAPFFDAIIDALQIPIKKDEPNSVHSVMKATQILSVLPSLTYPDFKRPEKQQELMSSLTKIAEECKKQEIFGLWHIAMKSLGRLGCVDRGQVDTARDLLTRFCRGSVRALSPCNT
ncbi:hypothetical protein AAMO2058_001057700 [Amorphochlora amoebiformis]